MESKVPFQVMLERDQHHRLGRVAAQRGVSIGALIRESVAEYLAGVGVEEDPLLGLIGLAEDHTPGPHGDAAEYHDAYLADAIHGEIDADKPIAGGTSGTRSAPRRRRRA